MYGNSQNIDFKIFMMAGQHH